MPDSTINGLTALTGANVDQTADQLAIWDNSAATTKKITRTELLNGVIPGDIGSAIRAAASDYAGVAFDGATTSTRITSTLTGQNIGTGDFSLWSRFRVPALAVFAVNPAVIGLGPNASDTSGNSSLRVSLLTGGSLSVRINNAAGVTTSGDIANFATNFAGQVVDVVVTRTGSTLKVFINGTDTAYTGTPAANESINSVYCHTGIGSTNVTIFSGSIYRSVVFNRALSASDVVDLIETGVNPADQWGTQTATYTKSTFALGSADSWAVTDGSNITATTGSTAPDATTDWLKVERTGASAGRCDTQRSSTLVIGNKRYRGSALIYNEDCGTQWFGVQSDNYSAVFASSGQLANGAQGTISQEFITGNSTALRIGPILTSTSTTISGVVSNGGNYFVKAITVTRIGAIVDLDFTTGIGYQATDTSTNRLDGTLFGGVGWTQPKKQAVLYATTNTNGNQQILATTAIPTNAFIEAIVVNSDGTGTATTTVSVGTASAGTQIVNAGSISTGRNVLTLATRFSSTGNLWVNANGTSNLQFTILYTDAA